MKILVTILSLFSLLSVSGAYFFQGVVKEYFTKATLKKTKIEITNEKVSEIPEFKPKPNLFDKLDPINDLKKISKNLKRISLNKNNTLSLRGPVTVDTIKDVSIKLLEMSDKLSKNDEIFLVLNTPGGSISAGNEFIELAKSIPQKIHTITLNAASMGFMMVQFLDKRYVRPTSMLMSHRASLSNINCGQIDGECESRIMMIKEEVHYMESVVAKRMKMNLDDYKKSIINESWIHGFKAKRVNAADEIVRVTCDPSLNGVEIIKINSFLGEINVHLHACPLITGILKIELSKEVKLLKEQEIQIKKEIHTIFNKFTDKYNKNEIKYLQLSKDWL